ncbi:2-oxoglutarate ferredoxin oxidoreductase subunit gamma [Anaerobranca californiensis DSM 14826]|jgi:2-oxoglutarate ferredoxin oxidoreductase subunit gamma|uniref:2-oxoglutarate ferredoxin oxidoreductase subunit gamma n=1 Tax=Anaerobranca californiensis DSM 14826 TaxID=1120989 RepID=A0A1M6L4B5_9FIRM|nr:2-oxoacid:acceptor oxidoreductase family protein [Anaerobranca californiensis]SHJ66095.1 2-oxoglutarate ferredoxin oxidoreductase subunit gamma [Anaerobranca californiensis DSM 14826]
MLDMILAGFGGQGVMSMGQLIAYAGMLEGKEVSWMPSYGPEMRGGTANCTVVVSQEPIGSPVVTEPQVVVAMNLPSLDKFESMVKPGGVLIINSSLINRSCQRKDITVIEIPANEIANELGNLKVANMVVLGALIAQTKVVSKESIIESLKKVLPEHRHNLIPMNEEALNRGAAYVK